VSHGWVIDVKIVSECSLKGDISIPIGALSVQLCEVFRRLAMSMRHQYTLQGASFVSKAFFCARLHAPRKDIFSILLVGEKGEFHGILLECLKLVTAVPSHP
jgi:hypothetical protein